MDDICEFYNEIIDVSLYVGKCLPTTSASKHKTVPNWNYLIENLKPHALEQKWYKHTNHMTMTTSGQIVSWPDFLKTNGNMNIKL